MEKRGDSEGQKENLRRIHILIPDTPTENSLRIWHWKERGTQEGGGREDRKGDRERQKKERGADWQDSTGVGCGFALNFPVLSSVCILNTALKLKKQKGACVCVCLYLFSFVFSTLWCGKRPQAIVYPLKQCNKWFIEAFDCQSALL